MNVPLLAILLDLMAIYRSSKWGEPTAGAYEDLPMTCYIIAQEAAVTLLKEVMECHCRLKDKEQLPLEYDYEIPTFGKDPKDHWGGSVFWKF